MGKAARVVWDPVQFPHLPHLKALEAGTIPGAGLFDAPGFAGECLCICHRGTQILLIDRTLQLNVCGANLCRPVHLFADAAAPAFQRREQTLVLAALGDLQLADRLRPERFLAEPRGARLRSVLLALDGWLAGVPHRGIAIELFGSHRVAETWNDPRGHLRDAVRRAISRGRALMNGGYRQFVSSV